jgi:hypothetical protein
VSYLKKQTKVKVDDHCPTIFLIVEASLIPLPYLIKKRYIFTGWSRGQAYSYRFLLGVAGYSGLSSEEISLILQNEIKHAFPYIRYR